MSLYFLIFYAANVFPFLFSVDELKLYFWDIVDGLSLSFLVFFRHMLWYLTGFDLFYLALYW